MKKLLFIIGVVLALVGCENDGFSNFGDLSVAGHTYKNDGDTDSDYCEESIIRFSKDTCYISWTDTDINEETKDTTIVRNDYILGSYKQENQLVIIDVSEGNYARYDCAIISYGDYIDFDGGYIYYKIK